jgi:tetratricopeptide (TPR) repeat protein
MKNRKFVMLGGSLCLTFAIFVGCGERSGDGEYAKAMNAWEDGNLALARSLFEKSIRKSSSSEKKSIAWNQLGLILWQLDETEAAVDAFNTSCDLSEELSGANQNLGTALLYAGRLDEARLALSDVLGEEPANRTALTLLSLVELKSRNWKGASQAALKSLAIDPRNPDALNTLALAELHMDRNSETALKRLQQILSIHPDYAPAIYNMGMICEQWQGNPTAALNWYKKYLSKAGSSAAHTASAKEAIARLSGKKIPQRTVTAHSRPDARRFMAEGGKLLQSKNFKAAIPQYQKAIQADPKEKSAYYNLGLAYFYLEQYSEAIRAYIAATKLDPRFEDAHYMLSLAYFKQRKWNEAEQSAKALQKLNRKRGEEMLKHISAARR